MFVGNICTNKYIAELKDEKDYARYMNIMCDKIVDVGFESSIVKPWLKNIGPEILERESLHYWIYTLLDMGADLPWPADTHNINEPFLEKGLSEEVAQRIISSAGDQRANETPLYWICTWIDNQLSLSSANFIKAIEFLEDAPDTFLFLGGPPFLALSLPSTAASEKTTSPHVETLLHTLKEKSPEKLLWHHACSWQSTENIITNGIHLGKGMPNQDFSHSDGFYLNPDYDGARDWCAQKQGIWGDAAILTFAMCPLEGENHLDLTDKTEMWVEVVSTFRSGKRPKHFRRFKSIYGSQCKNPANLRNAKPQPSDGKVQLTIRDSELAEFFHEGLVGITFFKRDVRSNLHIPRYRRGSVPNNKTQVNRKRERKLNRLNRNKTQHHLEDEKEKDIENTNDY